jgi:hypothetical protein
MGSLNPDHQVMKEVPAWTSTSHQHHLMALDQTVRVRGHAKVFCHLMFGVSDRQFNRLPPFCHDLQPRPCESEATVQPIMDHVNPAQMISSKESMN